MNQETRATLEIIAPSVDEAVEKGLAELGLRREDVEIEILDEKVLVEKFALRLL